MTANNIAGMSEVLWEKVGDERIVPSPGILGNKKYWTITCCGNRLTRLKVVQEMQHKTSHKKKDVFVKLLAHCPVCGAIWDVTDNS